MQAEAPKDRFVLTSGELQQLIDLLAGAYDIVVGPVARDGALTYGPVRTVEEMAGGWRARTQPGGYVLEPTGNAPVFGAGPTAFGLKPFLHPPEHCLFKAVRRDGELNIAESTADPPRYAFVGVRACDLAAMARLDRVLLSGSYADPVYAAGRHGCFVAIAACEESSSTCFCESMGTAGTETPGSDLVFRELSGSQDGAVLVQALSSKGWAMLQALDPRPAPAGLVEERRLRKQERTLEADGLPGALRQSFDHPRWEQTAARCLSCGNCTSACPTCFCVTVEESSSLDGTTAERWIRWDSCHSQQFTHIHGGSVRLSVKSRLRQFILHKLCFWEEQFGELGCVGCGRCIAWCPAGIDITEEAAALRTAARRQSESLEIQVEAR